MQCIVTACTVSTYKASALQRSAHDLGLFDAIYRVKYMKAKVNQGGGAHASPFLLSTEGIHVSRLKRHLFPRSEPMSVLKSLSTQQHHLLSHLSLYNLA